MDRMSVRKKSVNLSIDHELLEEAKSTGVNMSAVFERALKLEQHRLWLEANKEAFAEYNANVEKNGVWSDGLRPW